jgi:hypothetical protein
MADNRTVRRLMADNRTWTYPQALRYAQQHPRESARINQETRSGRIPTSGAHRHDSTEEDDE